MNALTNLELAKHRAELLRDGGCCVRNAFDAHWIELVRSGLADCYANPSPQSKTWTDGEGRFFQDGFAWRRIEPLRRFVFESPAAQLVASLMGSSRINLYMDHLLMRDPKTVKTTPWHHDTPYCNVDGTDFCTIWLPLDPIRLDDGLRLVKGSHTWRKMFLPVNFDSSATYSHTGGAVDVIPDIDSSPDTYSILSWEMAPSDCIVFYCNMLHSAPSHPHPDRARWVYSTRWTGDDAKFVLRDWLIPPLPSDPGLKPGDRIGGDLFPRMI